MHTTYIHTTITQYHSILLYSLCNWSCKIFNVKLWSAYWDSGRCRNPTTVYNSQCACCLRCQASKMVNYVVINCPFQMCLVLSLYVAEYSVDKEWPESLNLETHYAWWAWLFLMYIHFPFHERHEQQKTTCSKEENRDIIILRRNVRINSRWCQ